MRRRALFAKSAGLALLSLQTSRLSLANNALDYTNGEIITLAGGPEPSRVAFTGDGGPSRAAGLAAVVALAVTTNGDTYLAQRALGAKPQETTSMVHVIRGDGSIMAVAGSPAPNYRYDAQRGDWSVISTPQTDRATQPFASISGLLLSDTYLYVSVSEPTGSGRIVRIDLSQGRAELFAGGGSSDPGDKGAANKALLHGPGGMALALDGSVVVAEFGANRVRRIDKSGLITTVAGSSRPQASLTVFDPVKGPVGTASTVAVGDGGTALSAFLSGPRDVAVDSRGNTFIAETMGHRIRRVDSTGRIVTVAGNGLAGYAGDAGPAILARLYGPHGVAVDANGNVVIADTLNHRVRVVDTQGVIHTIAGTGQPGHTGDQGAAIAAQLDIPTAIALGPNGRLYLGEEGSRSVREITFS